MMKLLKTSIAMAALLTVSVGAMAGKSVSSAIPGGAVLLSDNSAETMIDRNCTTTGAGCGTLDIGDSLRGILNIDNIAAPVITLGTGTAYNELTAIFQTVVTGKTFVGVIGGIPRYDYTFAADASFATEFGVAAGTAAIFFEDATNNFKRQDCGGAGIAGTIAQCEATAIDGNIWASFGISQGLWKAAGAAEQPGAGAVLPLTTSLGSFGIGLDFIINNTGYTWNKVQCKDPTNLLAPSISVDFCGQGGIIASGRNASTLDPLATNTPTPYELFDNVDFTANRVPEPTSIALVGLALLGLGATARRSKKQ